MVAAPVDDAKAQAILAPGETLWHLAYGAPVPDPEGLQKAARRFKAALRNPALLAKGAAAAASRVGQAARNIDAANVVSVVVPVAAILAADSVIHAIGMDPTTTFADIKFTDVPSGGGASPVPDSRVYWLGLTSARLVLLELGVWQRELPEGQRAPGQFGPIPPNQKPTRWRHWTSAMLADAPLGVRQPEHRLGAKVVLTIDEEPPLHIGS